MKYAGFGTRVLNFLIDTIVIFILAMAAARGWRWYVYFYGYRPLNFGWFFWGIMVIYYFLLEYFWSKSVGKWLTYSRVVNLQGRKPGLASILIRSLTRIILIDSFFIPFLDKTLHDYFSKTVLVQD